MSAAGPGREAPLPDGWELVVGLEVHVELSTATKLFCGCANRFGDEPNTNVCPVCLGLPGSLPVVNAAAVDFAMRLGRALGCEVRPAVFARKNYFYPDMPKDYQISQYDQPTNIDGRLELPDGACGGHRAGPHRGGHRQDHPHRRGRAHPRRRLRPGGLQPGRRASGGDRQPPRHPLRRAGPGLCAGAAGHRAGPRRVRCPDGGGLNAGGRQRVGAALRLRRAAHPLRDQEPEFAALPRPCDHLRSSPPCGLVVERGAAPPGDPPLGRGGRAHHAGPLQGGRRGLPLLPGPRPGAAGPVGRDHRRDRCGAAPAARGPTGRTRRSRRGSGVGPGRGALGGAGPGPPGSGRHGGRRRAGLDGHPGVQRPGRRRLVESGRRAVWPS